jgi:hypothetical protein
MPNRVAFLEQTRLPVYGHQTNAARDFYFRTMIQIREPISVAISSFSAAEQRRSRSGSGPARRMPTAPTPRKSGLQQLQLDVSDFRQVRDGR